MEKPAGVTELRRLIQKMQHRERFVFPLAKSLKSFDSCMNCSLEVYSTDLMGEIGLRKQQILWSTVCIQGKFDKKWNTKRSQLERITPDKFLQAMLDLMA